MSLKGNKHETTFVNEEPLVETQTEDVGQTNNTNNNENDSFDKSTHSISLKFRCSDTSTEKRRLCKSFWEAVDHIPGVDRIIARGSSEKEVSKSKLSTKRTPTPTPCDELQELLEFHIDELVLSGLKAHPPDCSTKHRPQQPSANMLEELQEFDDKVKTEISIPPKTPRPTRSQLIASKLESPNETYSSK